MIFCLNQKLLFFVRNCFRINRTSNKSTNVNQKIFSICKRRSELGQKSILSLNRGFWPTTQRRWTAYRHIADRNQIDTFKPRLCLNFVLCSQVNTQKLQSMVDNTCCLLFQHTAVRQQVWNIPSLRTRKEANLILKQMCGSSYPISNLTSKTDLWKASTSISFVTWPVQWRE